MPANEELSAEIDRLKATFPGADENRLASLSGMIEQAAYETIYLRRLNAQALNSGLVQIKPGNPQIQRTLPVSGEIAKHSAALTNILDKLQKWLGTQQEEEDNDLEEFE